MSKIIEMIPLPDRTPVPSYRFSLSECLLMVGSASLGMYVLLTGIFAAFKIWMGI